MTWDHGHIFVTHTNYYFTHILHDMYDVDLISKEVKCEGQRENKTKKLLRCIKEGSEQSLYVIKYR